MRVILSRKGFDSGSGGVPSPILPDGRMISLPIPDRDAPTKYGAIQRDGIILGDLVTDLSRGRVRRDGRAHLDPDLDPQAISRRPGWRPIFGQQGAALGHLRREGVGPGDLFLFFGVFRHVELQAGRWRYVGSPSVHAIWGWMVVGAVCACRSLPPDIAEWAAGHPHLCGKQPDENDVFVAAETLCLGDRRLPGAGIFAEGEARRLTEAGASLSRWSVPLWMHPDRTLATLSYHRNPKRWTARDDSTCRLRSVGRGQEFVLKASRSDLQESWLSRLFEDVP